MLIRTVYFFTSITLFLSTLILIKGIVQFRVTGRNIFGEKVTSEHPAYESAKKFTSNFRIVIWLLLAIMLAVNMAAYAIFLSHKHTSDADVLLWGAPIASLISTILLSLRARHTFPELFAKMKDMDDANKK